MKKLNFKALLIVISIGQIMAFQKTMNAQTWSQVGDTITGTVESFTWYGSELITGGSFIDLGSNSSENYIAQWNTNKWSFLGSTPSPSGAVWALVDYSSSVAVGGSFNTIYEWNGTSWSSLGNLGSSTRSLILDGSGNLLAGGDYTNVEKYNGTSWSAIGGTFNGSVYSLCEYSSSLYAAGSFTTVNTGNNTANRVAKWNGTTWVAVGTGMNQNVEALIVFNGDLYAGGTFTTADGNTADYIAKWDGTSWSAVSTGMNNAVYSLAESGNYLYAGGSFTSAGGSTANHVARYDDVGGAWSSLGTGTANGTNSNVNALSVDGTASYLYVGGSFTSAGGNTNIKYIAKWAIPATRLTGINEVYGNTFVNVYPNPSNGTFSVAMQNVSDKARIEVYNLVGQKVYQSELNADKTQIDLSNQSAGIYLYKITTLEGSHISNGKVVVQ
jgi:hypothetical protein